MSDLVAAPHATQKKLKAVLKVLEDTPAVQRGKRTKKLQGYAHLWRYALEDPEYRIVYEVDEQNKTVKLRMMGPRKDNEIYKRLGCSPDKGPTTIPIEMVPQADPEYIADNPEAAQSPSPQTPCKASNPLPPLNDQKLKDWNIDSAHWPAILHCATEDDLLNVNIPQHVRLRVIDCLWPSAVEQVVTQPTYEVQAGDDIDEVRDGNLTRLLLNLDDEQRKALDTTIGWPVLVKGGPGTGKSIVAIYKAASLIRNAQSELFPKPPRVLFTTYTNALINASRALMHSYLGDDARHIEMRTVSSVASRILSMHDMAPPFVMDRERQRIIDELFSTRQEAVAQLPLPARNREYLSAEFEWVIEGWALSSFDEYVAQERPGRVLGLTRPQRNAIWDLYVAFKQKVEDLGRITHEGAQAKALSLLQEMKSRPNQKSAPAVRLYDYVFVDEVQDLKPIGLRLCAAMAISSPNVYLTADMNQKLYGKGVSWISVADSLRFRRDSVRTLTRNYRSTDQLARASKDLLQGIDGLDGDTVSSDPVYSGPKPLFRHFQTKAERNAAIAEWIQANLKSLRLSRGCAAILCPTNACVEEMVVAMQELGLPSAPFKDDSSHLDRADVKVMTIHNSKGLEFPVVAIPDFRADAFAWLRRDPTDDATQLARTCYFVACTRAMKRLLVTRIGTGADALSRLMSPGNWDCGE
jgi:superfamily I DNA/RNA helicase/mRNA-degrading endonuclease RelE of RelBE toxin-antitoxin system